MSKSAYGDPALPSVIPPHIRELGVDDLGKYGITQKNLVDPTSGFKAKVFVNTKTGEVTVAYAGTDDPQDYDDDIDQARGILPQQYIQARALGKAIVGAFGNSVSFTGHSLGGGLAMYAALSTNKDATVFNPAALHSNNVNSALGNRIYTGSIRAYVSEYDPLDAAQKALVIAPSKYPQVWTGQTVGKGVRVLRDAAAVTRIPGVGFNEVYGDTLSSSFGSANVGQLSNGLGRALTYITAAKDSVAPWAVRNHMFEAFDRFFDQ